MSVSTSRRTSQVLIGLAAVSTVGVIGVYGYTTNLGLGIRAQLGQTTGRFEYAVALYNLGQVGEALVEIEPLVADGFGPSLALVCGFVNDRESVAPTLEECVNKLDQQPARRHESLTDIAFWAQEWDTAAALLDQRLAMGDMSAHFDRARLIRAAPSGRYTAEDLLAALEASNAAQDPRGQYASVVLALDISSQGAISPVLAELLDRQPKLRSADAYFELAKLMQTGVISSDIGYVEVLQRADSGGNPHAARYLVQYYLSNPDQDPTGSERQKWMKRAAGVGDAVAQYNLAVDILALPPETRDMAQVVDLLDKSAKSRFVPAINLLGATLWQMPSLLPKTTNEVQAQAMQLMQAAAEQGDVNAHFNLGNIYLFQQDQAKAMPHLRAAAGLGSQQAREMLVAFGEPAK